MRTSIIALLVVTACVEDPAPDAVDVAATSPADVAVPVGNHVVAEWRAVGVQIYECADDGGGRRAWVFHAPLAILTAGDGALVAFHFGGVDAGLSPGPYWRSTLDANLVKGGNPVSVPRQDA